MDDFDRLKQQLDQQGAQFADVLAPQLRRLHENFKREGFTDDQAMRLVVVYFKRLLGFPR